jgi:hypothetical protein
VRTAVVAGALVAAGAAGCAADEPRYGQVASAATVDSFLTSSCSTSVVLALSIQIAEEVDCMMPGQLVRFEEQGGIRFNGSAVLPYLAEEARADLYAATAGERVLLVNSGFRTVVQQYLLREWFERGRCGIAAAALPGNSNHESGRAIDVDNWQEWTSDLAAHGWDQTVPGDEVHFDHLASPDIRGADVHAFQRLWNRNHPGDAIAEDGDYGPQTAARLAQSPAEGFPTGAECAVGDAHALDVVEVVGPETIRTGELATFTVRIRNVGTATWPATAALETATGAPSVLADPATWESPARVAALGEEVAAGAELELVFDVLGPAVDVATPIAERFAIADGDTRFGSVPIAVTVTAPGDGGDGDGDGDGDAAGGCSAGGDSAGWLFVALVLILALRAGSPTPRGARSRPSAPAATAATPRSTHARRTR